MVLLNLRVIAFRTVGDEQDRGGVTQTTWWLRGHRLEIGAASARRIKAVIVVGNALASFILMATGFVIHRGMGRRSPEEQGLRQVNDRLVRRTAELSAFARRSVSNAALRAFM